MNRFSSVGYICASFFFFLLRFTFGCFGNDSCGLVAAFGGFFFLNLFFFFSASLTLPPPLGKSSASSTMSLATGRRSLEAGTGGTFSFLTTSARLPAVATGWRSSAKPAQRGPDNTQERQRGENSHRLQDCHQESSLTQQQIVVCSTPHGVGRVFALTKNSHFTLSLALCEVKHTERLRLSQTAERAQTALLPGALCDRNVWPRV
ncbi:hypothetical protein EYF80_020419 [Liparis tanakae]|uniref:Transmembrane protein n=1 Tax=Liparis tanakae TaxID=230148 RepID=A0A4Z2HUS9_9TELE|nr:hypothetical protein EYF80_020419 [Liparis tanakae]